MSCTGKWSTVDRVLKIFCGLLYSMPFLISHSASRFSQRFGAWNVLIFLSFWFSCASDFIRSFVFLDYLLVFAKFSFQFCLYAKMMVSHTSSAASFTLFTFLAEFLTPFKLCPSSFSTRYKATYRVPSPSCRVRFVHHIQCV